MIFETIGLCLLGAGAISGLALASRRSALFVDLVRERLGLFIAIENMDIDIFRRKVTITGLRLFDLSPSDPHRPSPAIALSVERIELSVARKDPWFPIGIDIYLHSPTAFLRLGELTDENDGTFVECDSSTEYDDLFSNWSILADHAQEVTSSSKSHPGPLLLLKSVTITSPEGGQIVSPIYLYDDDLEPTDIVSAVAPGPLPTLYAESPSAAVEFLTHQIQIAVKNEIESTLAAPSPAVETPPPQHNWDFFGIGKRRSVRNSPGAPLLPTTKDNVTARRPVSARLITSRHQPVGSLIAAFESSLNENEPVSEHVSDDLKPLETRGLPQGTLSSIFWWQKKSS